MNFRPVFASAGKRPGSVNIKAVDCPKAGCALGGGFGIIRIHGKPPDIQQLVEIGTVLSVDRDIL